MFCSWSDYKIDSDNFQICKEIEENFYQVIEDDTGNIYNAKIIPQSQDFSTYDFDNFVKNALIMAQINHPAIVRTIGFSQFNIQPKPHIGIIREEAKNGSLSKILKKCMNNNCPSNFTNTIRQKIITGVAKGMSYLHEHRFPILFNSNEVLLDEEFNPLISMLENSSLSEEYKIDNADRLVPYMSPEMLYNNETGYNEKSNIYAYGVMVYEIVTNSKN